MAENARLGSAEAQPDPVAVAASRLRDANTVLLVAQGELRTVKQRSEPLKVAEAKTAVAEAKAAVAEAELGFAKAKLLVMEDELEQARKSGDEAAVVEAEVAVAEAKVAVAEAKVAVAEAKWGSAGPNEKGTVKSILDRAIRGLEVAQDAYERALRAGSGGAAARLAGAEADSKEILDKVSQMIQDVADTKIAVADTKIAVARLEAGARSDLSDSTTGRRAVEDLQAEKLWSHLPGDVGRPIIDADSYADLKLRFNAKKKALSDTILERWVVHELTPYLRDVVSTAFGDGMVVVNSERHEWLQMTTNSRDGFWRPDGVILPREALFLKKTDEDKKFDSHACDFLFGGCAGPALYETVEGIFEAKPEEGPDSWRGLGQGIRYVKAMWNIISVLNARKKLPSDTSIWRNLVVFDINRFLLVRCRADSPHYCTQGKWTDAGSFEAMVAFITHRPNRWVGAFSEMSQEFGVHLFPAEKVKPGEAAETSAFLGAGLDGRVFRVRKTDSDSALALKLAMGESGAALLMESERFTAFKSSASSASFVADSIHRSRVPNNREFYGLLISPVGSELPRTQYGLRSALAGLLGLHRFGWCHGDARVANVLWVGTGEAGKEAGKAVWIDYRTLLQSGEVQNFWDDVSKFATSLNSTTCRFKVTTTALPSASGNGDTEFVNWLAQQFAAVWKKGSAKQGVETSASDAHEGDALGE